jgi:hypothetical protein
MARRLGITGLLAGLLIACSLAAGVEAASRGAATGILANPPADTTYALVVGISDYFPCGSAGGSDLRYSDDDADSFYAALTSTDTLPLQNGQKYGYGIPSSNVTLLKDCAATREAILDWFTRIGTNHSDDDIIFYVSGHGARVNNYYCGGSAHTDGDSESQDNAIVVNTTSGKTYICDGELKTLVNGTNAFRKVILLDISYPSGFLDDFAGASNTVLIPAAKGEAKESTFTGPCAPGHGAFTCYFVVRGIQNGEADNRNSNPNANQDHKVTFEEAFDYTVRASNQKPNILDTIGNDFLPTP